LLSHQYTNYQIEALKEKKMTGRKTKKKRKEEKTRKKKK